MFQPVSLTVWMNATVVFITTAHVSLQQDTVSGCLACGDALPGVHKRRCYAVSLRLTANVFILLAWWCLPSSPTILNTQIGSIQELVTFWI